MNADEFFAEAKRLKLRMLGTPEETRAALDAKDAEIERLRAENTRAYAEGRGDQYKDDGDVVRLLFDNLDDADAVGDGFINTSRVRELLAHFVPDDEPQSAVAAAFGGLVQTPQG